VLVQLEVLFDACERVNVSDEGYYLVYVLFEAVGRVRLYLSNIKGGSYIISESSA
jgi:hypothetical protein